MGIIMATREFKENALHGRFYFLIASYYYDFGFVKEGDDEYTTIQTGPADSYEDSLRIATIKIKGDAWIKRFKD
jgi:hypothetical protein